MSAADIAKERLREFCIESLVFDTHDQLAALTYFDRVQKQYFSHRPNSYIASVAHAYSAALVYIDEMKRTYDMLEGRKGE